MNFLDEIANEIEVTKMSVEAVLKLVGEGCTIPFISRYRKEMIGGIDEVKVRSISNMFSDIEEREKRRSFILDAIEKMEKLTPELKKQIQNAKTLATLEDIYAPFKSKKKTKAQKAEEAGLIPLSEFILDKKYSRDELLKESDKYKNSEHKVETAEKAIEGALDILMAKFSGDQDLKEDLRGIYWQQAKLVSKKKDKCEAIKDYQKFKDYFEYEELISKLKEAKNSHRFLALKRGNSLKILKVDIEIDPEITKNKIRGKYFSNADAYKLELLEQAAHKANILYIHPSFELEIKSELRKSSDEHAINVFGKNLRNLLLQPYLGSKSVLGIDPGIRTGCKLALIDDSGKFIFDHVIYPFGNEAKKKEGIQLLEGIIEKFKVEHIAIGNGTNGRETLEYIEKFILPNNSNVKATLINEDGASIYSASDIARKEFPDKDITVRGAISIARRFQDPLSELVKIDPKSIGVGQYQHDVNQTRLKKSLGEVVESCVNFVGVDLNTASAPLLSYISGIGPTLAQNIVNHREKNGIFKKREDLNKVTRFSEKVFQQCAGFLRIYNGDEPLDSTFIHPETYSKIYHWSKANGINVSEIIGADSPKIEELSNDKDMKELLGEYTLNDVVTSLKAPTQDPRTEFKSFEFRKDIKDIKDLKKDEWYPGVVTNITQFGAFIDLGIKTKGLLHVSQLADKFVENALDELKVGEGIKVKVIEVDIDRDRVSLSRRTIDKADMPKRPRQDKQRQAKHKSSGQKRPRKNQELKNNAFASLKNFKIK